MITMKYYTDASGRYLGGWDANPPAGAIEVPRPPEDARQIWDGKAWGKIPLDVASYDAALVSAYQAEAQSMGYESWQTCALRAYRPGPFEAEGTAFYDWMEACNVKGYQILADVTGGKRDQPSIKQFLAEIPAFVRPTA